MADKKQKIIIVIDGLNHLVKDEFGDNISWLPENLPSNIRLIVSAAPSNLLDVLNQRNWPILELKPFEKTDRRLLIQNYLSKYGKQLSTKHINQIISHPSTANPLFLLTVLEETRLIDDHLRLSSEISRYLSAETPESLFNLVLQRYESDYDTLHEGLSKNILTLLCISRRGLKESEIMDLLSSDTNPFPQVYLSIFLLASSNSLINRSGIVCFSHNSIQVAVENRYLLHQPLTKQNLQNKLVNYFNEQVLTSRKIEELPWQLYLLKDWVKLSHLLGDLSFFSSAVKRNRYEIRSYWSSLIKEANIDILATYDSILKHPDRYEEHVENVHLLLVSAGYRTKVKQLEKFLIEQASLKKDDKHLASLLNQSGIFAKYDGDINLSWEYFLKSQEINLRIGNNRGLITNFSGQVSILLRINKLDDALFLSKWQENLSRQLDEPILIASALAHQSEIFRRKQQWDQSIELRKEQLLLARQIGDPELEANALINLAKIELDATVNNQALETISEEQQIASLWRLNQLTEEAYHLSIKTLSIGLANQI